MQELEHWKTKFDIAGSATEGYFSRRWVAENLLGLSEEEYINYEIEKLKDLEQMHVKKENFEAAAIIQNKINKFKIKLKQLWKNNSK